MCAGHRRRVVFLIALALLVLTPGVRPASAAPLTGTSMTAGAADRSPGTPNASYAWNFTTATTATLGRITTTLPAGTGGYGPRFLDLPSGNGNEASTPDSAANSIVGDLDIRIKASLVNWQSGSTQTLVAKRRDATHDNSYSVSINGSNRLELWRSPDGYDGTARVNDYALPAFAAGSTQWLRVTFLRDNGGGNSTIGFYTSNDGVTWTLLGNSYDATVSTFDSAAPLEIGAFNTASAGTLVGSRMYYAEVRSGVAGTIRNVFDPASAVIGSSSWTASTGETWTVNRSGTFPADIATELTPSSVTGVPSTGIGTWRLIDQVASYKFSPIAVPAGTPCSLTLSGFTTTPTAGSYPSTITTYSGVPAVVDTASTPAFVVAYPSAGVAFVATIAPQLTFTLGAHSGVCNGISPTTGSTSSATSAGFGTVIPESAAVTAQDLGVMTNAGSGYVISISSSGPLTAGAATVLDLGATNASPGPMTSPALGYTTSSVSLGGTANRFANGGTKWAGLSTTPAEIERQSGPTLGVTTCVAYQFATAATTKAGTYATNITYRVIPSF